jgi:membrane-bound lytic murein transglycosylase B
VTLLPFGVGAASHPWQKQPNKNYHLYGERNNMRHCIKLVMVILLASCAAEPAKPPIVAKMESAAPPVVQEIAPAPKAQNILLPAEPDYVSSRQALPFSQWLVEFRREALDRKISAATLDIALANLVPSQRVIDLDRNQPDVKASYYAYMHKRLTASKISSAQSAFQDNKSQLMSAQSAHGVPAQVIVGIWGMETNFGSFTGNMPVIQSLASLAYDGRRSAMFREELFAALTILDKGHASLDQMRGSWAGAFGQAQFMPSSYLRYAVDGDGSGNRDIWKSLPDVFGSIGNYLKQAGWDDAYDWGLPVTVPAGFDPATVADAVEPERCKPALRKHSVAKPISEWKRLGFVPNGSKNWPEIESIATLVQPDGPDGPAFLTLPNYRTILNYNCSNYYALSVLLLADAAAQ